MNWSEVPILAAIVVGFVGFCLMVAAFVQVTRQGGWRQAMQSGPDGRWSPPRCLMFAGASIGIAFWLAVAILFLIPGGIPWMDGSDGGVNLVVFLTSLAAGWYFNIKRPQTASRH
jgi:hypothetical protein